MKFKVSKLKFIKNELLKIYLIVIIISMFTCYPMYTYQNFTYSQAWFYTNMPNVLFIMIGVFIYKNIKYYHDILYIDRNNIKLYRKKVYKGRHHIQKTEEEIYNVIKIDTLKEKNNKFVLYGNIEVEKENYKNTLLSGWKKKIENTKYIQKLIIRKNFENEEEIRNLLKNAIELNIGVLYK